MLPASNRGAGMNLGFPDVCVTPVGPVPTPIPYPNMAMNATAVPFAMTVFLSFVNAVNMGSQMPMTLGDQAGTLSPFMGPGRYTMGNPTVNIEGLPGINLLCPTTGNNMVNALGAVVIPSIVNVFFSYSAGEASAGRAGEMDLDGIRRVREALRKGRPPEDEAILPGGLAYLALPVLSLDVPARVYAAVQRFLRGGMEALILDLRDNPGGDLTAFIELASDFLEPGSVVITMVDADGDETEHRARQASPYRFPLFVLVNGATASAAELFAGCLQAHGRAVIAGERTFGKGTAQALLARPSGPGADYATVASFKLPGGRSIQGAGVAPDIETASQR